VSEQSISDHQILYEDNHLIAVWKEAGVLVQGDQTGDKSLTDSLGKFLKEKYQKPGNVFTGLIHRIDRPVSGLVIFAKTSKALTRMNELFKERKVKKTYWCIVEGRVEKKTDTLISYLKKDPVKNKARVSSKFKEGFKQAELNYKSELILDRYTLLEVTPKTGRQHQIRAQLASIGYPIKGDLKYGAKRSNKDGSISLHARGLEFIHPVQNIPISIVAYLPDSEIWKRVNEILQ